MTILARTLYLRSTVRHKTTAAKGLDFSLPDCEGQTWTAILEDAPMLLKLPTSECRNMGIRLPKHMRPKSRYNIEEPMVILENNPYGHLLEGLRWEGQCEKKIWKMDG